MKCSTRAGISSRRSRRGQRDRENVEPVIEVAAEFVARYHFLEITVRRRDQPNVYLMGPAAPQTFELLFLQDTQVGPAPETHKGRGNGWWAP